MSKLVAELGSETRQDLLLSDQAAGCSPPLFTATFPNVCIGSKKARGSVSFSWLHYPSFSFQILVDQSPVLMGQMNDQDKKRLDVHQGHLVQSVYTTQFPQDTSFVIISNMNVTQVYTCRMGPEVFTFSLVCVFLII